MVQVAAATMASVIMLQCGVSVAIGAAPNAALWSAVVPSALPPELVERGAYRFRADLSSGKGSLVAWVVEPRSTTPAGTVVLLHGVRMDKRSSVRVALAICDAGYRAVLVDLPGHGESGGRYLTYGDREARDVSRLLDALQASGVQVGPLGAYGFSYGAAVAIDLAASDSRIRGVVAVSPFASLREVIRDYRRSYLPAATSVVPDGWFQQAVDDAAWFIGFDADASAPVKAIGESSVPTLLIHGDADTQVPLRHSQMLAREANGRAKLVVLRGGTHDSMPVDARHVIRDETVAWFDAQLRPSAKHALAPGAN